MAMRAKFQLSSRRRPYPDSMFGIEALSLADAGFLLIFCASMPPHQLWIGNPTRPFLAGARSTNDLDDANDIKALSSHLRSLVHLIHNMQIPSKAQILVIGGGPGGSYSATTLVREGFDVVLLEASEFPRYHIGESMLPSLRTFLSFIDCDEKMGAHGFTPKQGAAIKLNQYKREGYTDFVAVNPKNQTWNVVRSEFDQILLDHAAASGVKVFTCTKVTSIDFEPTSDVSMARPIRAHYAAGSGDDKSEGTIDFDYLVDASGRAGVMSTKYLKNRKTNASLKNIACWGYWKNTGRYMPGTNRENAPWFEALSDETGWAWFIPLHNGTTSVGVVMDTQTSSAKKAAGTAKASPEPWTLTNHYVEQLKSFVPGIWGFLDGATMATEAETDGPAVKSATDYSYAATCYSGDHFRLVGDAAAFIDPFFSSGVHLAFTGALAAAASIASSVRGEVTEKEAGAYHDAKVGVSYTRFLLVVMAAYKQIRSQDSPVLSDINEDNFDRAFDIIRPVIQGTADVGKHLTADELQKTLEFCQGVFAPADPVMIQSVSKRLDPSLLNHSLEKIMTKEDVEDAIEPGDDEARYVLRQVNANKPLRIMYAGAGSFDVEEVAGFVVVMKKGELGLRKLQD
ncbi:FAD/NAD(P)-binding domain-containing protein [Sistotremastrum niveocremeum HHB9708]|uniref:FAD/NAD(P)-binding domain-containing protein n=1 Tax=Sistotremastrum niveocremeum HHB9708 TaxID=1314777 RepID=A0A164W6V8_9AGAM|nr:FAD/NAD(P)-binding domain-containing protein [Sistotremastrum niveocremeum HHB9708]